MALRLGSLLAPRARRCASTLAADGSYAVAVDNPYSGETYCEVGYKTSAEALAAVDAGAAAQRAWAAETTVEQRVAVCAKFMEAIKADADRIANDISGMMGKPVAHARGEIGGMMERCEMMMALAPKALAPELLPAKDNFVRTIEKDPVGVVLCIAPWNYPFPAQVARRRGGAGPPPGGARPRAPRRLHRAPRPRGLGRLELPVPLREEAGARVRLRELEGSAVRAGPVAGAHDRAPAAEPAVRLPRPRLDGLLAAVAEPRGAADARRVRGGRGVARRRRGPLRGDKHWSTFGHLLAPRRRCACANQLKPVAEC